jgi:acetyl-CoA carboxylase biotin carboxyl carrier protein
VARRRGARGTRAGGGESAPWSPTELIDLAVRHNLAEIEVEARGTRIRVVREHPPAGPGAPGAAPLAGPPAQPHAAAAEAATAHLVTVEAPMVGTFYRASSPTGAPFVSEGDLIKEGQVLCIIEAMKLMNEIEARVAGRIARVLVENAQPVEYGQPLFLVEPLR